MSNVRLFIGGRWREGSHGDAADVVNLNLKVVRGR